MTLLRHIRRLLTYPWHRYQFNRSLHDSVALALIGAPKEASNAAFIDSIVFYERMKGCNHFNRSDYPARPPMDSLLRS